MGSGNKRKDNDVLRVNIPQKRVNNVAGNGNGGALGGSSSIPIDINRMCPAAFDVTINPKQPLPDKSPVAVEGAKLFVVNENVGKLSRSQLKIITECGSEGIRYRGRVLNRDKKSYARFEQIRG